ncbi:MAG: ComEC/Rec2 family competence protein [Peptoanaerobacter stomatis]|uniref:ComEC/Rec2 family competence protein n=1 Tax=Peptoanaerobacter stomatis TaxID=796937 RepID=UPI003FA08C67
MIKNFEIRRFSFFIFIIILCTSAFIIYNNSKNINYRKEYVEFKGAVIDKIEIRNAKYYIYSQNFVMVNNYISDEYRVGDFICAGGYRQDLLSLGDYGLYLKSKGYDYRMYIDYIEKIGHKISVASIMDEIRQNLKSIIDFLYKDYSAIIRTLIIADREFISKDEIMLFSRAGISHIISISGFHIVLIAGIFFNITFFLSKKQRYIISVLFTLFYVILTGANPPAVRAYIFYVTFIASIFLEERYDIFSIGFLLSAFYMILNPYVIYDFGFCLSFMSVFSISMFYKIIFEHLEKIVKNNLCKLILSMVCVTLSAQILTIPYVYYNFGIVSLISVITNIISVPLISLAYPFMLLSIIFVKIPFVRDVFCNVVNFIIYLFYKSNEILTSINYSYINFDHKSLFFVIITYIIILFLYTLYIKIQIWGNYISIDKARE